jgi:hypothetical protein
MRRQLVSKLVRASSEAWTLQQGPMNAARTIVSVCCKVRESHTMYCISIVFSKPQTDLSLDNSRSQIFLQLTSVRGVFPEAQHAVNQPTSLKDALRSQSADATFGKQHTLA